MPRRLAAKKLDARCIIGGLPQGYSGASYGCRQSWGTLVQSAGQGRSAKHNAISPARHDLADRASRTRAIPRVEPRRYDGLWSGRPPFVSANAPVDGVAPMSERELRCQLPRPSARLALASVDRLACHRNAQGRDARGAARRCVAWAGLAYDAGRAPLAPCRSDSSDHLPDSSSDCHTSTWAAPRSRQARLWQYTRRVDSSRSQ